MKIRSGGFEQRSQVIELLTIAGILLCSLLAMLTWTPAASVRADGTIHRVPEDFATIQEAIDAAAAGDTIEIVGGVWMTDSKGIGYWGDQRYTISVDNTYEENEVLLSNNLFNANGTDVTGVGTITNTHPITGAVDFVAPELGDLHLMPTSAAINAGDPAGVPPAPPVDIEGTLRPYGPRVDAGAYEWHGQGAYLPQIFKQ